MGDPRAVRDDTADAHGREMREGEASVTARRVAGYRLTFDRVATPYGDPASDERLARDVTGSQIGGSPGSMTRYLAARTSFFDHVVVGALDRGVTQVVIAAAGYDGRSLRYAKPGVRWYELDHPDTQRDKRSRLERLGVDTGPVSFVPADFTVDPIGDALVSEGYDPEVRSLFLCEGVAVYLDLPVLESLFDQLGHVATVGSRLAISLSVAASAVEPGDRQRFQDAVAALGEPARLVRTVYDSASLFAKTGWRVPALRDGDVLRRRARDAGFLIVERA